MVRAILLLHQEELSDEFQFLSPLLVGARTCELCVTCGESKFQSSTNSHNRNQMLSAFPGSVSSN